MTLLLNLISQALRWHCIQTGFLPRL